MLQHFKKKLRSEQTDAESRLFWNNDILKNIEGVLVEVLKYLSPSPGKLRMPTSPTEGRGDCLANLDAFTLLKIADGSIP